jgi:hypothetical protein
MGAATLRSGEEEIMTVEQLYSLITAMGLLVIVLGFILNYRIGLLEKEIEELREHSRHVRHGCGRARDRKGRIET